MTRKDSIVGRFTYTMALAAGVWAAGVGCKSKTTEPPSEPSTLDWTSDAPPMDASTPDPIAPAVPTPVTTTPPPAVATPMPEAGPRMHTVARGDTVYNLAVRYYGSGNKANQDKILAANPGLVPTKMSVGKQIVVP